MLSTLRSDLPDVTSAHATNSAVYVTNWDIAHSGNIELNKSTKHYKT